MMWWKIYISYLKMAKNDQRDISYLSLDIQACSLVWTWTCSERERERDGGEGLKGRRKERKGRIECLKGKESGPLVLFIKEIEAEMGKKLRS